MLTHRFDRRFVLSACIMFALMLMLISPALAAFTPSNGEAATLVIGQSKFTTSTSATSQKGLNYPGGVAVDPLTHKVFVADYKNNRVLRYASLYTLSSGMPAEAVLGQPNFTSKVTHASINGMNSPASLAVDSAGRLWVADAGNNRVLRFDNAAGLSNGANANAVLGQLNFTNHSSATSQSRMNAPDSLTVDAAGRLWVADHLNNRVLRFDNAAGLSNGANANAVLGQLNFTNHGSATSQSRMNAPAGVFVDAAGILWVADYSNNRVLRFNNAAGLPNGANANVVLGQLNFTNHGSATSQSRLKSPSGVTVDNTGVLYVSDASNNRILVFNAAAGLANGAAASYVLGQTKFTTSTAGTSATTLHEPTGLFYDPSSKALWAADSSNNRVLMYGTPTLPTPTPTNTPTYTPTFTPSNTPTNTPTFTPSNTPTFTPSNTPTFTPSNTPTFTPSNTPTFTPSNTPTFTPSNTPTFTPSNTPKFTPSNTPTNTPSNTPTYTPSNTPTPVAQVSVGTFTQPVAVGQNFDVVVNINTSQPSFGAQVDLKFDPSLVKCDSADLGTFYSDWATAHSLVTSSTAPTCDNTNGIATGGNIAIIGGTPGTGPTGSGSLFVLHFTALAAGTSALTPKNEIISDTNGNPLSASVSAGQVTLATAGADISVGAFSQPVAVGQNFDVDVNINAITPSFGGQVDLKFDP
ncbi:MAG: hypothetical protein WCE68_10850, partial [Anaerolineales bacterium]